MAAGCKLLHVRGACGRPGSGLMAVDPPLLDRIGRYELNIVILAFGWCDRLWI
ncbi:hypothetical protein CSPAE12_00441 [Colletotrichum incanum]|nr:hypothetical protein CSPAE12_00441 [Colletotrichum incanum]